MGKQNDEFVIILDLDKVFSVDELSLAQDVIRSEERDENVLDPELVAV